MHDLLASLIKLQYQKEKGGVKDSCKNNVAQPFVSASSTQIGESCGDNSCLSFGRISLTGFLQHLLLIFVISLTFSVPSNASSAVPSEKSFWLFAILYLVVKNDESNQIFTFLLCLDYCLTHVT